MTGARWKKENNGFLEIVKPDREALSGGGLRVSFVDADGNPFPNQVANDAHGNPEFAETRGGPEVVFTFMDANGNRWRSGTSIETPERRVDYSAFALRLASWATLVLRADNGVGALTGDY